MNLHAKIRDILTFAHIGDRNPTRPGERDVADLLTIVAEIERGMADRLDFVVLPGDSIEDLEAFHAVLAGGTLQMSVTVGRHHCLFVDTGSPDQGGPDVRFDGTERDWVSHELAAARDADLTRVVFVRSDPADPRGDGEAEVGGSAQTASTGTGYTIVAAPRAGGPTEADTVGCSIATLEGDVVGWRFKLRADLFPFVLITAPADHRLARGRRHIVPPGAVQDVHAIVLGDAPVDSVACRFGEGAWEPMRRDQDGHLWVGHLTVPDEPAPALTVRAVTAADRMGQHTIQPATARAGPQRPTGAWPQNGIFATQPGSDPDGRHR